MANETKIVLGIEYDGSNYHGWQRQQDLVTVQSTVEQALSQVAADPVAVHCAGRTDIGVHATWQVVHFITKVARPLAAWLKGANSYLPRDIRVIWAKELLATTDFHARFSALARHYRYYIYASEVPSAIWHKKITFCHHPLKFHVMQKAAKYLVGEKDFSAFRAADCQSKSTKRNVKKLKVRRMRQCPKIIVIDIVANAFLQHMVRNMVGSLLEVGKGKHPAKWIKEVLLSKDRNLAGPTADASGLYLVDVIYPNRYKLPKNKHFLL